MTARELLRACAEVFDHRAKHFASVEHLCPGTIAEEEGRAAALRALAERIDAEFARSSGDNGETWAEDAVSQLLARLDTPLPPGTGTQEPPR